jgi:cupin fold WbuC family metalloprotein
MNKFRVHNDEVLYTDRDITRVTAADVAWLKEKALLNPRKRIRLCAHPGVDAKVHEMLIVHARDAYVRPHKHLDKPESFHVIEGLMTVLIFDDQQKLLEKIPMGPPDCGRDFFYRLARPAFHTVVIESEIAVFHETTGGPFNRSDTLFPAWAPEDKDPSATAFHSTLRALIEETR